MGATKKNTETDRLKGKDEKGENGPNFDQCECPEKKEVEKCLKSCLDILWALVLYKGGYKISYGSDGIISTVEYKIQ